jgi:hypothetical protein
VSFSEADVDGVSDGLPNTRLYLSPTTFNRFFVTREINDGLLAPRFEPSQRAWVLRGFLTLVQPAVPASVPRGCRPPLTDSRIPHRGHLRMLLGGIGRNRAVA